MPQISVIVPVYNAEKYLTNCIESILKQSFDDFELILVDDGSSDTSASICKEYAEKDKRIQFLHQNNQGQAAARNNGIKIAQGDWVHFVDADDLIHPDMLNSLYKAVVENNAKISMCGAVEEEKVPLHFFEKINPEFTVHEVNENYLQYLYLNIKYRYWIVWGKLIDIDIVRKVPFSEGKVYEDNAVVCQWLYEAKRVVDTDNNLYFYRINYEGTTKKSFSIKRFDFLWALEEQINFYESVQYEVMLVEICKYYMANITYIYTKTINELNDKHAARSLYTRAKLIYRRYRKQIKWSGGEKKYIYGVFHPNIIKIYWIIKCLQNIFKEEGSQGFCNKVYNKLLKKNSSHKTGDFNYEYNDWNK